MIITTILSKDNSMGMGAFLGVIQIVIGLILFTISDAPTNVPAADKPTQIIHNPEAPPRSNTDTQNNN